MNIFTITIFLLSVFIIGFCISTFLDLPLIMQFGLSFLFGSFFISYAYFLAYLLFDLVFSKTNLLYLSLSLASFFLILAIFSKKFCSLRKKVATIIKRIRSPKINILNVVLILAIATIIISSFYLNTQSPIIKWDAITLYDFRAQVLSQEGVFSSVINEGYYLNYPPYTSLLHVFFYLLSINQVKVWYSILFLSFAITFYSLLKTEVNSTLSLLGTLLLTISPRIFSHSLVAYTNLPYAIFLGLGIIFLWVWLKKGSNSYLLAGSFLLAASTWIRNNDPLWVVPIFLILLGSLKHRKSLLLSFVSILIILFTQYPWNYYKAQAADLSTVSYFNFSKYINNNLISLRLLTNLKAVFIYLLGGISKALKDLFGITLIAITYDFINKNKEINYKIFTIILLIVTTFVGILILSITEPWWDQVPDSLARLLMIFVPLSIYIIITSSIWNIKVYKK